MQRVIRCRNIGQKAALQILLVICGCVAGMAQTVAGNGSDTIPSDSLLLQNRFADSIPADSLGFSNTITKDSLDVSDTLVETMRISPNAVSTIVDYFAQDSVEFDITNKKSFLFNNTNLLYEDIELKSHYVTIDFSKNELHAEGIIDSNEVLQGRPVFKQGSYEFNCHEIDYNFTSKKGLIKNIITQEGEGYLHGEIVKKNADNSNYIWHGKYTTCNLEHPHFEIDFFKGKVIPNDKIVTGALYVRIADIPTFLALPFGFFPNSDKRTNGLVMPTLGTHGTLGNFLNGIGYYFAIKEMVDFKITADIYMALAIGANLQTNYVKRYNCNGSANIQFTIMPNGERTLPLREHKADTNFHWDKNFSIQWRHTQDRKAHPTNSFSADVNFQTTGFRKSTINQTYDDRVRSTTQSSVSFSTSFKGKYSLGIGANISQNLTTGDLGLDLPQINFNVQQFYPFRKKKRAGKLRWYEEISMQYTANMRNGMQTTDSILFSEHAKEAFKTFNSEMTHNIPIRNTIKLFKHISWNNSITFNEVWNMRGAYQDWAYDSLKYVTIKGDSLHPDKIEPSYYGTRTVYSDTLGFFATHNLTFSTDLSTTLYGMYMNRRVNGKVYAVRHTLMPLVGLSYSPYINKMNYRTYYDSAKAREMEYDIPGRGVVKTSARINFSLNNKLEMKVRLKKKNDDDEQEFKKVTLLESFAISTSYDFMRDSLRWEPLSISGRTTLFKYINLSFRLSLDPYCYNDSLDFRFNTTEWAATHKRLFRLSSTTGDIGFDVTLNKNFFTKKDKEKTTEPAVYGFKDWSLSVGYRFGYNKNWDYYNHQLIRDPNFKYTNQFTNNLTFSGRLPLTEKWGLEFRSGYDITNKRIFSSEFSIERDLHCWVMSFRLSPFGTPRFFEFMFRAKAGILDGVKWNPKREIQDYY